ncbi:MAG: sterol desaturase family protein [Bacteroidota bacterium]
MEFIRDTIGIEQLVVMLVFFAFIGAEILISSIRHVKLYEAKDTLANLALGFATFVTILALKGVGLTVFGYFHQFALFDIDMSRWYSWVALLLVNDFLFYLLHRLAHASRFFYAFHQPHHSSGKYNFSVSVRGNFALQFLKYPLWIVMPLLGFDPWAILLTDSILYLYQMWIHTELIGKLGPLEWVFNTPTHHRVHHSNLPGNLVKNCGGIFIIWDRLFGTFKASDEKLTYGVPNDVHSSNPVRIAFQEFVDLVKDLGRPGGLKEKLDLLFGTPRYGK